MEQAGYDANYSLGKKVNNYNKLIEPPLWDNVIELNYPNIKVSRAVTLDFGAGGKGYLVDLVVRLIESLGFKNFCVDAGGDIVNRSAANKFLEVALENPKNIAEAIGIAKIGNQSLCGSAGNRRKWGQFTHIIDSDTLKSPDNIAGVWVVAESGLLADAISTALFFTEPAKLLSELSFEYLIMYIDSSVEKSDLFPAEIFYK